VTLAIGDGANDVNMILQAHVGVGIAGKEGQQAARSADYSIGEFKSLKPLMFIHGREAYRRNAMLIAYAFYKNILYVVPQYYFGFNSAFSGQPLYESFIYQLYNITMTSLPIMYYALFDWEYLKPEFMSKPKLYHIGMNNECWSNTIFVKWLFYALIHGFLLYFICIISVVGERQYESDGKEIGFWIAGHTVYGGAVFVANLVILHQFNNFTGYGEALVALMCLAFFVFLGLESSLGYAIGQGAGWFADVNHIARHMFSMFTIWAAFVLMCGSVSAGELCMRAWKKVIGRLNESDQRGSYAAFVDEDHPKSI